MCILQSHLLGQLFSFVRVVWVHLFLEPLHWLLLWPWCILICNFVVDPVTVTSASFAVFFQWMPVLAVDLDRFTERCRLSGTFICHVWIDFEVSIRIAAFLDTFGQARVFRTCLVVQVDRSDVALGATTVRLNCHSKAWTVATPPVQYFSPVQSSASPWWDSSSSSSHGPEAEEG